METKRRDEQMKICLSGTDKYEIRPLESEGERVSYYDALTFININGRRHRPQAFCVTKW